MRIRLSLFALLILSIAPVFPSAGMAAERFALVIGNAKYPDADAPLKEPINDARDIAEELKRDGFTIELGENLNGDGMHKAFDRLYGHIKPGSVVLIFFSGFGIQSNRQSYMIPVDAQIWTEADVRRDGFSLETVLGEINSRGAGVKIALIDASRRNPYERRFRSFSAGLAPVIAPNGTLVMYSAALSSVISDNGGDHSLFVQELLKEIRGPGLMAEETLNRTRVGVTRASRSEQVPWISSSLAEEFSFVSGARPPGPVANATQQPAEPAPPAPQPRLSPSPAPAPVSPAPAPKADSPALAPPPAAKADSPVPTPPPPAKADNPVPPPAPKTDTAVLAPPPAPKADSPVLTPRPAPKADNPVLTPSPAPRTDTAVLTPPPAPKADSPVLTPRPLPKADNNPVLTPSPAPKSDTAVLTPPPSAKADSPVLTPGDKLTAPAPKTPGNDATPAPAQPSLADDAIIKTLSARIAENPDDASALYRRGQVYASKGAYRLAIKDFDDTIKLSPKDVEAYNNRCWARTVVGDLQLALRDCNEALRLRPNFVDALDSRGLLNLKNGQNKNAIADFDAALKINPRLTSSLYGRGLAKQRNGAIAEGDVDISNAKAMDPNIAKEFAGYGVH